MPIRQPSLPSIWLVSDVRNDAMLEMALARLPIGSGLIFRHYHLETTQRRARFRTLLRIARKRGHRVVLAGDMRQARRWGADGAYGAPHALAKGQGGLRLATAHSLRELGSAGRSRADAVLLSPVFPTRSHPGGKVLGPVRFRLLAAQSGLPVIALGGMDRRRAQGLKTPKWAAIDGICGRATRRIPLDS